jgi:hypothetical protein
MNGRLSALRVPSLDRLPTRIEAVLPATMAAVESRAGRYCEVVKNGHRTAELRSIELHRLVAERLREEPELLERARTRVADWIVDGGPVPAYAAKRWRALLNRPLPVILAALTEDSEEMRTLRSSSPFAGVLSQDERVGVIRSVR